MAKRPMRGSPLAPSRGSRNGDSDTSWSTPGHRVRDGQRGLSTSISRRQRWEGTQQHPLTVRMRRERVRAPGLLGFLPILAQAAGL